jgi:hypothetical protein
MPSDYATIRADNERRYGTDIGRIGKMLLADRYDDRTHFIFELLQNSEDALADRNGWAGSRAVRFDLAEDQLCCSHFGKPFDDRNVRGICGIDESTKDRRAIGRFGIGFKSVYAYTTRPEIHSGDEAFAIENYVWPTPVCAVARDYDETIIRLPLNAGVEGAHDEIARGLQRLGPKALLFLREIEEIEWRVHGGSSGIYMRSKRESLGPCAMRVSVIGQQAGADEIEESWLIFFRDVAADDGTVVGQIEIAFSFVNNTESGRWSIQTINNSPLVVFFPTVVLTQLGFLLQGPYRTTPSRDNVPKSHPWNQFLVRETASLLNESLKWLRDERILDVPSFQCLPLDRTLFPDDSMFAPLFKAVRNQMATERLLPTSGDGYVRADRARIARTQELRTLFTPEQLGPLFGVSEPIEWVSGEISPDRTPDVRQYLMRELDIVEVTPEMVLPRLTKEFLQPQPDAWVQRLYEFFQGQPALIRSRRLDLLPIIRLTDGTHVVPQKDGQPQAFLPSTIETSFPTVRKAVCTSKDARKFLESLGLTEPDPVDDVVWNILPKYRRDEVDVDDDEYAADMRRILDAFRTDSKAQREKLLAALRETDFVGAVAAQDGTACFIKPGGVYLATARFKELFAGVEDVMLVDDGYDCLRGEEVRELLEACGAARSLLPVAVDPRLTWQQKYELRVAGGCESTSGGERLEDYDIRGLDELIALLPKLEPNVSAKRGALLWEALAEMGDRRGTSWFSGTYEWTYYHWRSASFDSSFVRKLNKSAWVPFVDGNLRLPSEVEFDTLRWKGNPFLESKVRFKPPIIEQLAKEAGIDPGVLVLLKRLGVTSEEELRRRLGVDADSGGTRREDEAAGDGADDAQESWNEPEGRSDPEDADVADGDDDSDAGISGEDRKETHGGSAGGDRRGGNHNKKGYEGGSDAGRSDGSDTSEQDGSRTFISYIGTHPVDDEYEHDPDGLDREARLALEAKAIGLILSIEPELQRAKTNNPGFDLYEAGENDRPVRWVEVKAMKGSLEDRPVCMSRVQFDCGWVNGEAYWLYIVENADDSSRARILKVNDPAGQAKNFTFDRGWTLVATEVRQPPPLS